MARAIMATPLKMPQRPVPPPSGTSWPGGGSTSSQASPMPSLSLSVCDSLETSGQLSSSSGTPSLSRSGGGSPQPGMSTPAQTPSAQTSSPVHSSPSSQGSEFAVLEQMPPSHKSSVHPLLSSQSPLT